MILHSYCVCSQTQDLSRIISNDVLFFSHLQVFFCLCLEQTATLRPQEPIQGKKVVNLVNMSVLCFQCNTRHVTRERTSQREPHWTNDSLIKTDSVGKMKQTPGERIWKFAFARSPQHCVSSISVLPVVLAGLYIIVYMYTHKIKKTTCYICDVEYDWETYSGGLHNTVAQSPSCGIFIKSRDSCLPKW